MKAVFIGKGMYRITVRSKVKRERLSKIPEVKEGTKNKPDEPVQGVTSVVEKRRRLT